MLAQWRKPSKCKPSSNDGTPESAKFVQPIGFAVRKEKLIPKGLLLTEPSGPKQYFTVPYNFLVHDPNNSLIQGDHIVAVQDFHAKNVPFTVDEILAPFGKPINERPPLLSERERETMRAAKEEAKSQRREERLKQGIRPAPGKGEKWPKDMKEVLVDDGGAGDGKGPGGKGRVVLPGGRHKFGGINEESQEAQRRIGERQRQANENVKDRATVEETRDEEYQKEALDAKEASER